MIPTVTAVSSGEAGLAGVAYDPDRNEWRELPRVTYSSSLPPDVRVSVPGAVWTGAALEVITSDRFAAEYRPGANCWRPTTPAPGPGYAAGLYRNASGQFVDLRGPSGVSVSHRDPTTGVWSEPQVGLDDEFKARDGAFWADGLLVFATWHSGGLEGTLDAAYDTSARDWRPFHHACDGLQGAGAVVAGPLVIEGGGRAALDPLTGSCVQLPVRPTELLGGSLVWTGTDLIYLSGGPGDLARFERRAYAYQIADALDDAGLADRP